MWAQVKYGTCCGMASYPDITFYLTMRRKPLFYTINLVIPCETLLRHIPSSKYP